MEKGTLHWDYNLCCLVMFMCSVGTAVLEQVIVDYVFNSLLNEEKKRVRKFIDDKKIYQDQFDQLYPTNGHVPTLEEFDRRIMQPIIHTDIFNLPDTCTTSDYLKGDGLRRILQTQRAHLYKNRKLIGEDQWKKIDPDNTVDVGGLDISCFFFIIRNAFPDKKPSNGKWSVMPRQTKQSVEDDVCRIKLFRNVMAHCRTSRPISNDAFDVIWSQLTNAFRRLWREPHALELISISSQIKAQTMNTEIHQKYEKIIDRWIQEEECLGQLVEDGTRKTLQAVSESAIDIKQHTTATVDSAKEDFTALASNVLICFREEISVIVHETVKECGKQFLGDGVTDVLDDRVKLALEDLKNKTVDTMKDAMTKIASTFTASVISDVRLIAANCLQEEITALGQSTKAIEDATIEIKQEYFVERLEQQTADITAAVERQLDACQTGFLGGLGSIQKAIGKTEGKLMQKMDEIKELLETEGDSQGKLRKQPTENLIRSSSNRSTEGDSQGKLRKQPTDAMTIEVKSWYSDKQSFHPTSAALHAVSELKTKTTVTIVGPPKTGKTMILKYAALSLRDDGYDVYPISDPRDIDKYLSADGKQVFVIDDALGMFKVDQKRLKGWRDKDQCLRCCLKETDVKVIWTVNSILASVKDFQISGLLITENQVDMTDFELGPDERKEILVKHLDTSHIDDIEKHAKLIMAAKKCDYFFLPGLCRRYQLNAKWQLSPEDIFHFPFEFLVDYFQEIQIHNKDQFAALGLCALLGLDNDLGSPRTAFTKTCMDFFEITSSRSVEGELQRMLGMWVRKTDRTFDICHDIIRDAILFLIAKETNVPPSIHSESIRKLSNETMLKRVRVCRDVFEETSGKYMYVLEQQNYDDLVLRWCLDCINGKPLSRKSNQCEEDFEKAYRSQAIEEFTQAISDGRIDNPHVLDVIALSIATDTDFIDVLMKHIKSSEIINSYYDKSKNIFGTAGYCPVHYAVEKSSYKSVDLLLKNGADVNILSADGLTPLHLAVKGGNVEMIKLLRTHNADLAKPSESGLSPLHFAIDVRNLDAVKSLVNLGADKLSTFTADGHPPLHFAISKRNSQIVQQLLELDVNCNIHSINETPPLQFAIELLATAIADHELTTEVHLYIDIIDMLVNHPHTNLNFSSDLCDHPLHMAVLSENLQIATLLLKSGRVNVNFPAAFTKMTPLHLAVLNNNTMIALLLLSNKADVTLRDVQHKTPNDIAVTNNFEVMRALLESGTLF